jgi:hypothetical protein
MLQKGTVGKMILSAAFQPSRLKGGISLSPKPEKTASLPIGPGTWWATGGFLQPIDFTGLNAAASDPDYARTRPLYRFPPDLVHVRLGTYARRP